MEASGTDYTAIPYVPEEVQIETSLIVLKSYMKIPPLAPSLVYRVPSGPNANVSLALVESSINVGTKVSGSIA